LSVGDMSLPVNWAITNTPHINKRLHHNTLSKGYSHL
jgi:hypothetical protein